MDRQQKYWSFLSPLEFFQPYYAHVSFSQTQSTDSTNKISPVFLPHTVSAEFLFVWVWRFSQVCLWITDPSLVTSLYLSLSGARRCNMYNSYLWLCLERDVCLHASHPTRYTSNFQAKPFIHLILCWAERIRHCWIILPFTCITGAPVLTLAFFRLMIRLRHRPATPRAATGCAVTGCGLAQHSCPVTHWWLIERGCKCTPVHPSAHIHTVGAQTCARECFS